MNRLLAEVRHNPLLWLLVFVPVALAAERVRPDAAVPSAGCTLIGPGTVPVDRCDDSTAIADPGAADDLPPVTIPAQ